MTPPFTNRRSSVLHARDRGDGGIRHEQLRMSDLDDRRMQAHEWLASLDLVLADARGLRIAKDARATRGFLDALVRVARQLRIAPQKRLRVVVSILAELLDQAF